LGTKYLVVLCAGSTLPLAKQSLDEAPYKLSEAVAKLAGITFSRIQPSLGVSNWPVIYYIFPRQLGTEVSVVIAVY
jgi:hypothetical protein